MLSNEREVAESIRQWRAIYVEKTGLMQTWPRYSWVLEPDGMLWDEVHYFWTEANGRMKDSRGQRRFRNITFFSNKLTTTPYEDGVLVDADDLLRPNIMSAIDSVVGDMGSWTGQERELRFQSVLRDGHTPGPNNAYLTFDGQELFGEHPGLTYEGSATTFNNLLALPLTATNLEAAYSSLMNFRDTRAYESPHDKSMQCHLLVGQNNRVAAKTILTSREISGSTNTAFEMMTYEVVDWITNFDWILYQKPRHDRYQPVAYHEPVLPELLTDMEKDGYARFWLRSLAFSIRARFGFKANTWTQVLKSTPP